MYDIYIIKEGDSFEKIANEFNTSKDILEQLNGNLNNKKVGSQLIVPNTNKIPFKVYKVKKGENIYQIAQKFNLNYNDILLINGIKEGDYVYEYQELLIPKDNIGVYVVKNNETLNTVALKLNISPKEIINNNSTIYLLPEQMLFYKKER